jgi:hypothetical protein
VRNVLLVGLLFLYATTLNASSRIEILPDFGLNVTDTGSVKLPSIFPEESSSCGFGINVISSSSVTWDIVIFSMRFSNVNNDMIPMESVTYRIDGGAGDHYPTNMSAMLPIVPKTIYSSTNLEKITKGTLLTLTVNINPPRWQAVGKYRSNITVLLADNY